MKSKAMILYFNFHLMIQRPLMLLNLQEHCECCLNIVKRSMNIAVRLNPMGKCSRLASSIILAFSPIKKVITMNADDERTLANSV